MFVNILSLSYLMSWSCCGGVSALCPGARLLVDMHGLFADGLLRGCQVFEVLRAQEARQPVGLSFSCLPTT